MERMVELLLNDYIGDDFSFSRQVKFSITEDCLKDYLQATEEDRSIKDFLATYDSDEALVIYDYASDDGRILSEDIIYSDLFIESYNEYKSNGGTKTEEDYYWSTYRDERQ